MQNAENYNDANRKLAKTIDTLLLGFQTRAFDV